MKRLLPLVLLLGGCTTLQHPRATAAVQPVRTPCVETSQIPAEPPMVGARFNGDAKHDLQVLAPNAIALRQWGEQLQALLAKCVAKAAATPKAE